MAWDAPKNSTIWYENHADARRLDLHFTEIWGSESLHHFAFNLLSPSTCDRSFSQKRRFVLARDPTSNALYSLHHLPDKKRDPVDGSLKPRDVNGLMGMSPEPRPGGNDIRPSLNARQYEYRLHPGQASIVHSLLNLICHSLAVGVDEILNSLADLLHPIASIHKDQFSTR